jgi:hypothetical protein
VDYTETFKNSEYVWLCLICGEDGADFHVLQRERNAQREVIDYVYAGRSYHRSCLNKAERLARAVLTNESA